ncbi:Cys-tRNA(Pro) deacylase [Jongsikchunia kroppenstedtii]|uniref:Cys-tRNA(Pro) deacylase n=1 Tax=Jongsikchunia kroppenstedtii TaxID=1121721 RepID=UPI0003637BAB
MIGVPATPAIAAATAAGIVHTVHKYRHDRRASSFGDEAAEHLARELGTDPRQIFKTIVLTTGSQLAVAVVPVPDRVSTKAVAAAVGAARAELADPQQVQKVTGYVLGGVSPLGQKRRLPTVIDESALTWPTVFCSAGRRGLEIELAPVDLVSLTDAIVTPITA